MIGPLLGKERELTLMAVLVSFVMLDPVPGVAGDQAARGTQMHAQGVLCTKSVGKSRAEGEETTNRHPIGSPDEGKVLYLDRQKASIYSISRAPPCLCKARSSPGRI